jgi:hypothetical protein
MRQDTIIDRASCAQHGLILCKLLYSHGYCHCHGFELYFLYFSQRCSMVHDIQVGTQNQILISWQHFCIVDLR